MPLYAYQAYDSTGKKRGGTIEAQTEREAKDKLREQGVMVSQISAKSSISGKQNLKGENLYTFTLQIAQLLNAGLPLYESLVALEEQYRNEAFHRIILSLSEQVKAGTTLSAAMANYPGSFNHLYRAMVTAGESVGALDLVFEKLSQLLARQDHLKKEIRAALIYPCILGVFALLVISLLLGFVIPSIEGIFADRQLNGFTEFVLKISHIARDYWWAYIPAIALTIAGIVYKLRTPAGRLWMEKVLMHVPLIKTLMVQTAIARFTRTMATLQQGGLTMIDALRIGREVMGNAILENEIRKAEAKIIEGSSLSAELTRSKWIPLMVSRMLVVGEESGSTVSMMNRIAEMYESEIEKTLSTVMALAQPVILIFMGLIIGTVLLAVLLPLTDVSSFTM